MRRCGKTARKLLHYFIICVKIRHMEMNIPDSLIKLSSMAQSPIYVVGGFVRNRIAGLGETDIDIAGPAVADMLGISRRYRTEVVNHKLGTVIIKYNEDKFEYTPFRVEKYAEGGAHTPVSVMFTSDINKDALRRDFTCNAIYYDIANDKIIDPLGGIADIEHKILRAYDPQRIFASDGLRVLRMVRIACETGFKIDAETAKAAKANVELLKDISVERRRDELMKILVADVRNGIANAQYRALRLLNQIGAIKYLVPQLEDGAGLQQNPLYHKYDVLEHTFQTVRFAPPEVRLAALMHDIGKPYCMRKFGNMHGHEKVSENIVRYTFGEYGLRFPKDVIEETAWLCANHMYDRDGKTKEAKARVFVAKNFDLIDKLTALIDADRLATGLVAEISEHRLSRIKKQLIEEGAPLKVTDLVVSGSRMILEGIQPVKIGALLESLWRECVINPRLNNEEWLVSQIKKHADDAQTEEN